MLKKIRIKNFKCYGPSGIDFDLSKINFIFGDNSAGKSTFLQFLSKLGNVLESDGSCDRDRFNSFLFKNDPKAEIMAKFRFVDTNAEGGTTEAVWGFCLDAPTGKYRLLDDKSRPVDKIRLKNIMPYEHVPTTRKSDSPTNAEKSSVSPFSSSFSNQVRLEKSQVR